MKPNQNDGATNESAIGTHIVFLRGFKTTLRPPLESDIPLLMRWINDPDVRVGLGTQLPKNEADEREFVQRKSENSIVLIIEVGGKPIGTMGIHGIKRADGTATTGAMIGEKEYWNKGYGTDAKMALLDYAFNSLNLRKIKSQALAFNKRSIAYSLHCGYIVEGVLKEEVYRNGLYHDLVCMAITRKAWTPYWKKWQKDHKSSITSPVTKELKSPGSGQRVRLSKAKSTISRKRKTKTGT